MSYLALARKWRPRTFSELLGQAHLTTALINSLDTQRIHHAYLFTGTRGVGKTSVARLLAKALNCEQGVSSQPCLACDACLAIEQGCFVDLIEIDGASKTRVEDTRDVLENVQYAPTCGRYKIYLIDEVHMLSQHSFNALLKTLEEPPAHVKFLLATTDPQKLPVTVLSRCLQFNLRHMDEAVIAAHLQHILTHEAIQFEQEAIALLAKAAEGSMRDALSLLDQAIATCPSGLSEQSIKTLLGFTQQDYASQILMALSQNHPAEMMAISQNILQNGGHFSYVLDELLNALHQMAVYQALQSPSPLLRLDATLAALTQYFSREDVQLMYQIVLKSKEDIIYAPSLIIGFEMMLLRMHAFMPAPTQSTFIRPILTMPMETPVVSDHTAIIEDSQVGTLPVEPTSIKAPSQHSESPSADISWAELFPQLNLRGLARTAAENAHLKSHQEQQIVLQIEKPHASLFTKPVIQRLEEALSEYFGSSKKIQLELSEQRIDSPAVQKKAQDDKARQDAVTHLEQDVFFKQLQSEFSAEVVRDSVMPVSD